MRDDGGDGLDEHDSLGKVGNEQLEDLLASIRGPVDWRGVASSDAKAVWTRLREWVEWFRAEFAFDHRVVPPCWYRHSALVSVLSALHDHWRASYEPLNSPAASSDWHRELISLEQRLRDWASRTGCTVAAHRPDVVARYLDDTVEWDAHVAADVAARAERAQAAATNRPES